MTVGDLGCSGVIVFLTIYVFLIVVSYLLFRDPLQNAIDSIFADDSEQTVETTHIKSGG